MQGEGTENIKKILRWARGVLWVRPYFSILCPSLSRSGAKCISDGSLESASGSHPLGWQVVLDVSFGWVQEGLAPKPLF